VISDTRLDVEPRDLNRGAVKAQMLMWGSNRLDHELIQGRETVSLPADELGHRQIDINIH
jgi:hypothetical protein